MTDFLIDYERKRRRAMHHFDVLGDLVERFRKLDRPPVKGELKPDSAKYEFQVPLERINPDVSLILGDFIYDTRASLDYLIAALVRSTGKKDHSDSQFPIYSPNGIAWDHIDQWWDSSRKVNRKLKGTPSGTKAALKPLQPFYGVPMTYPLDHPLAKLAALSNRDKHRRLNLLARRASVDFEYASGEPVFEFGTPLRHGPISERDERDAYVVTLELTPDRANMDVYLLATYDITLDEPPEVFGEVVEVLAGINEFIDGRVLPVIRSLL